MASSAALAQSVRFFGTGATTSERDVDRVKLQVGDTDTNSGTAFDRPVDVGATDFTVEFWIRPTASNVATRSVSCGATYDWINGNVVLDRDRYNQNRTFGTSLGNGRAAFGVKGPSGDVYTLCGSTDLRDSAWHHVALQRRRQDGWLWVFVDGRLEGTANGPDGDISYPDNGVPASFCNGPCTSSDPFIVLGAEKHDVAPDYPSFFGWFTELRFSNVLRYAADFTVPSAPFTTDAATVGLYHFDENAGTTVFDTSSASGGPSNGVVRFNALGDRPAWSTASPFSVGPRGTLQFEQGSVTVAEGAGSVTLRVTRVGGSGGAASVQYATVAGTAFAGSDFTARSGTLVWASGDAAPKSIVVPIVDGSEVEAAEAFTVSLSGAAGAALGSPAEATVTIADDDVAVPAGTLQAEQSSYAVSEGAGTVTIRVTRVGGNSGAASVQYATVADTALAGSDFTARSGTLTWASGDAAPKSIVVPIVDGSEVESTEAFTVVLSGAVGAALGSPAVATVTIADNDVAASPGTLQFAQSSYTVAEAAGTVTLRVTRAGGSGGAASVQYATSSASAVAGADFASRSGTLTWADGDATPKSIDVPILDGADVEGSESFAVSLSGAVGAVLSAPATATVTIADDDVAAPAGTLQFERASYGVGEAAGTVTVRVTRVGGSGGAAAVQYATAAGTAQPGADFTTTAGTLSWADGETAAKSITVSIVDGADVEGPEAFTVGLSGPTGAALGSPRTATITIADNDVTVPAGTLQFDQASHSVAEGVGTMTLRVTRVGGSGGAASVHYATAVGSALAGADFTARSGTLTWAEGEAGARTISVPIVDGADVEATESFTVVLNGAVGAALGSPATATVTIADDDVAPPAGTLQFEQASYSVAEGAGTISLRVTRESGNSGTVSVTVTTAAASATESADYTRTSVALLWESGDSAAKAITVPLLDDTLVEGAETFEVSLTDPTGGALLGPVSTVAVSILDDDVAAAPPPAAPVPPAAPSGASGAGGGGGGAMGPELLWLMLLGGLASARRRRRLN